MPQVLFNTYYLYLSINKIKMLKQWLHIPIKTVILRKMF